jgi:hypothetical protein
MSNRLTITGTITDREGKPIDRTHAEWMAHQFLTLLKWCGLTFDGSIGVPHGDDIYRTSVTEATPFAAPVKPLRVRHRYALKGQPSLRLVPSESDWDTIHRELEAEHKAGRHIDRYYPTGCQGCDAVVQSYGVVKVEATENQPKPQTHGCAPGAVCHVGHLTKVCAVCLDHKPRELVNADNKCVDCIDKE